MDIKDTEREPCLYCGNEMKQGWDEYTPFPYCDCPDFKKKEEILEKIEQLRRQLPQEKYRVTYKRHLINVEN